MSTTPERIQPNDVMSRQYWAQMCPNFTSCANSDATEKVCKRCGAELPGFIAEWLQRDQCRERRFYCVVDTSELPGKPGLCCFSCDSSLRY